jgi:hypothetical protein
MLPRRQGPSSRSGLPTCSPARLRLIAHLHHCSAATLLHAIACKVTIACKVALNAVQALSIETADKPQFHRRLTSTSRVDDEVSNLWSLRNASAERSPITTQGAMVLPVVTRGMIEPSAMRRFSIP